MKATTIGLKPPKGVFQFKGTGKLKHGNGYIAGHSYHPKKDAEPPMPAMWDGKTIGSVQEWRWILASLYYKVEFIYQMDIKGGRSIAGGQVLDFMMITKPLMTPVSIKGKYWHSGKVEVEDIIREATIAELYKGQAFPVVTVYDYELPDLDTAKEVFRRVITL